MKLRPKTGRQYLSWRAWKGCFIWSKIIKCSYPTSISDSWHFYIFYMWLTINIREGVKKNLALFKGTCPLLGGKQLLFSIFYILSKKVDFFYWEGVRPLPDRGHVFLTVEFFFCGRPLQVLPNNLKIVGSSYTYVHCNHVIFMGKNGKNLAVFHFLI